MKMESVELGWALGYIFYPNLMLIMASNKCCCTCSQPSNSFILVVAGIYFLSNLYTFFLIQVNLSVRN